MTKKILIFEDNPSIQTLLKIFFKRRGLETHVAPDGVDAVALVREHKPALILMDIIMPGKGGIEACGDLRREGVKTPIIMLSSKAYTEDRERGLAAGANAYLLKPFNTKELEEALRPFVPA